MQKYKKLKQYDLIEVIAHRKNLILADKTARKGKHYRAIAKHDLKLEEHYNNITNMLLNNTYKTSKYKLSKIYEPKERIIYKLPYYPDRITHHAIMRLLKHIWNRQFISTTYACIDKRGIHSCAKKVKQILQEYPNDTKYCLKIDIKKFYPSINNEILKRIIRIKLADKRLLNNLDEIIDSVKGVPIGNYLSQYFANLYLTYFDRWCKQYCHFYIRYADDIVILHNDKTFLHNLLIAIKIYLKHELDLELKPNYQIFPVESRGIDFVGYVFRHNYVLLRKSIKVKINKLLNNRNKLNNKKFVNKLMSYYGMLKFCNSKHYLQKIEKLTGIHLSNFVGKNIKVNQIKRVVRIIEIEPHNKYFKVNFILNGKPYTLKSKNKLLYKVLKYEQNIWESASKFDNKIDKQ